MSTSHTNKHIFLQSHKHIAQRRSFNRDLHCFLLILKLRHIFFNGQIYCMYSLYPFLHFFLRSFLIFAIFSLLLFIYICVHLFCPFLGNIPYYEILLFYGEGNGNPCLENPVDGRAWWAAVHGVAESQTRLKRLSSSSSSYSYILILQFLSYKMMSIMNRSFYFLLNNITYIKTSMFVSQLISVCFSFNFCVYI